MLDIVLLAVNFIAIAQAVIFGAIVLLIVEAFKKISKSRIEFRKQFHFVAIPIIATYFLSALTYAFASLPVIRTDFFKWLAVSGVFFTIAGVLFFLLAGVLLKNHRLILYD